jgi:hypothetical protein
MLPPFMNKPDWVVSNDLYVLPVLETFQIRNINIITGRICYFLRALILTIFSYNMENHAGAAVI